MIRELLHKMKKPDGKRRFGFRFGVWLLFAVMLAGGQRAEAQDNTLLDVKNYTVTNKQTNGYVSFRMLCFDDRGDNEWVNKGELFVKIGDKQIKILDYSTSDNSGRDVPNAKVKLTLREGTATFKANNGDQTIGASGQEREFWFSRDGNYMTFMSFDWYYPSDYEDKEIKFQVVAKSMVPAKVNANSTERLDQVILALFPIQAWVVIQPF